ncbi:chromate transporter [Haloplasma contractile]|uniref:Chromate transport protein n=1 Tax=Haloplasma contractile SSD-17B TaxID=1033810 RepID=U2EEQ4_9MOLU|nr:chromate transporter [Haloplasma contractile]ERJ13443.1 Chromate transport protein [Haloplasma contractile SSD-17B]
MKKSEEHSSIHDLFILFITFFKFGVFTIGGGYVMIPLIEKEMVEKKKWIKEHDIADVIALTQSIPGALAVNMSALVGYRLAGKKGAITSVFGVITPSFIIILLVATLFRQVKDYPVVTHGLLGIKSAVVALIIVAGFKIAKKSIKDFISASLVFFSVLLLTFDVLHPFFIILLGAFVGIALYTFFPSYVKHLLEKGIDEQ